MKKFTKLFKLVAALSLFLGFKAGYSQCTPSFGYYVSPSGAASFTSTSIGTNVNTYYYWSFGNGAVSSGTNMPFATTTYTANGTYTIMLGIFGTAPTCSANITQTISVTGIPTGSCNVVAGFSQYQSPNGVQNFPNNSTGTVVGTTYSWSYGDGGTSTGVNGIHTYSANGNYVVTLVANNNYTPSCTSTHTALITVSNVCALAASFNYSIGTNGNVTFTCTASGTNSTVNYYWYFGNTWMSGGPSMTTTSQTYTANGVYTVTLSVFQAPSCTVTSMQTITLTGIVTPTCNLNANFSYTQTSNGGVNFTNFSTGTGTSVVYAWNFGDGNTSSSTSPSHTYATNGTYIVTLVATNASVIPICSSTFTQAITVTSNTCVANSAFSLTPSGTPQYWYAIPASSVGVSQASWSWGDGTYSSTMYTSHTYSAAGNYSICLSVTLSCGATATSCYTYYISRSTEDNTVVHVDVMSPEMIVAGIKTADKNIVYNVSPNPSNGTFNVNISGLSTAKAKINVYNIVGKLVFETEAETSNGSLVKDINLDAVSNGVYFIKVNSDNKVYTKKLVINK